MDRHLRLPDRLLVPLYLGEAEGTQALDDHIRTISARSLAGQFTSPEVIGDEPWFLPQNGKFKTLTFRLGRMVVLVEGSRSRLAAAGTEFPPMVVEAAACQILFRSSQQAKLIGTPAQVR